ncbi:hypothetical protein MZD44_23605, partial [Escherichia coli]|nr:hypothetical protein [Escherichia coli]
SGQVETLQGMITSITPDARPATSQADASVTVEMSLSYYRCIDSLEVRKKPGGHWIIRDLAGLDLVGLASL